MRINSNTHWSLERDSVLAGLVQKCRHLNSDEISHEIENSEVIGRIYRNAAEQGSTAPPAEGEEVDYHYVALSKLEKGNIVELDGDLGGPVVTNVRLDPEQDLLSGAGVQFMKDFISSRTDAGQGFSLLALVQT